MSITFATGCDAGLFWNACALQESFVHQNPGSHIAIADFGMHPRQIAFLQRIGVGVPWPSQLRRLPHAWFYKTALSDFPGLDVDWLAWVDSDMCVVGPVAAQAERVAVEMAASRHAVAACVDVTTPTLGGFLAAFRGRSVAPFEKLLQNGGISHAQPYLNTGFVLIENRSFWKAWRALTFRTPAHVAYDQSSFNALAHADPGTIHLLEPSWNVHAQLLATTDPISSPFGPARLLHATSQGHAHHVNQQVDLDVGGQRARVVLKTFRRPDLRQHHLAALSSFVRRHREEIIRHQLLHDV